MSEGAAAAAVTDLASGAPVAVVVHRRVAPENVEAFRGWEAEVGSVLDSWPGFLSREITPPQPPQQVDWVIVQRFRGLTAARTWLQSDERQRLLAAAQHLFVGDDDIHIVSETTPHPAQAASALISSRVPEGREDAFLAWQRRISAAEARFDGFVGHRVERPVPGVREEWTVVLSFDTSDHLDAWLASAERSRLLEEGAEFVADLRVSRASYGFGFWSGESAPDPIFKSNLLVLLMLYPLVFLWGYFVSTPFIDSHGVPFWLSLFIGNVVSTQLLGWVLVPWLFRRFRWWLRPGRSWQIHLAGYAILVVLYALSMAAFAWLGAIRG